MIVKVLVYRFRTYLSLKFLFYVYFYGLLFHLFIHFVCFFRFFVFRSYRSPLAQNVLAENTWALMVLCSTIRMLKSFHVAVLLNIYTLNWSCSAARVSGIASKSVLDVHFMFFCFGFYFIYKYCNCFLIYAPVMVAEFSIPSFLIFVVSKETRSSSTNIFIETFV